MAKSSKELLNKRKKKKKTENIEQKKTREYRMYNAYAREKKRYIKFINVLMKRMKRQRLVYYSFLVVDQNEKVVVFVVLIDPYEHYHVYILRMYHIVL